MTVKYFFRGISLRKKGLFMLYILTKGLQGLGLPPCVCPALYDSF